MEESLSKFVTAILAIVIMFIFPVYIAYEKKDDISYALAVRYTQDFVDKVRSKGYLTRELYQDYASQLLTTGNTYKIEMEHRYVRFDPNSSTIGNDVNAVRNEEIFSTEHILNFMDNNDEHKYVMNVGDNFNVKIKNTNVTMATIIYNIVTVNMNKNNVRLHVDYGGKILADKWWGKINFLPGEEDIDYKTIFSIVKAEAYTSKDDAENGRNAIEDNDEITLLDLDSGLNIYYKISYSYEPKTINIAIDKGNGYEFIIKNPLKNKDENQKYKIYRVTYTDEDIGITTYATFWAYYTSKYGESIAKEASSPKFKIVSNKSPEITVSDDVKIPDGFYYVGGTKDTGLVISDNSADENKGVDYTCVGNQFVWVPVEDYSKFVRGTAVKTSSGSEIYKMTGTVSSYYYTEPYENGYTTEKQEYYAMMKSVEKYHGFYIARFEAGDGEATAARKEVTTAHKVVSKKNAYVYNYVPWGKSMSDTSARTLNGVDNVAGAVELSKNMYKDSTSVVSTLCYGVQWDAAMNFVSDATHNIKNSASWGNYKNATGDAKTNSGSSNMNYTTGRNEAWKAKNIYDLAGNVNEWTMESYSSGNRVRRGGFCYYDGSDVPAGVRSSNVPTYASNYVGFRVTLYIQ